MQKAAVKLYCMVIGAWFGMSALVDFVAVPTVFRNISSREEAGNIGMIIFSSFNIVEAVFAFLLLVFAHFFRDIVKWKKTMISTLLGLFALSLVYNFYMTPKITEYTELMRTESEGSAKYQEYEKAHQGIHKAYVKLDGAKLLILLTLMGLALRNREEEVI